MAATLIQKKRIESVLSNFRRNCILKRINSQILDSYFHPRSATLSISSDGIPSNIF